MNKGIEKDKWFKLTLNFKLKEDLKFKADEEYLELWRKIGEALGIEGLVADVKIEERYESCLFL